MSKGKSERNESGNSDCLSPDGNVSSGRRSEFSARSEAWLGSGRIRPSSWDDSDEELSPKPQNSQCFRIYSGDCKKSQESVLEEINEIKNQFFRSLAKEEETSSAKAQWSDRRQSPARIRRRTKSSSSSSPVFEHRPETPEEIDTRNFEPEGDEHEISKFESDHKFSINNFHTDPRSKKISSGLLESEKKPEEQKTRSPDKSSDNSKHSDEEEETHFSRTCRKLSQILEVEEVRREAEEPREEEDEEKEAKSEGNSVALMDGELAAEEEEAGEEEARTEPAAGRFPPGQAVCQEALALEDFGSLGEAGPFRGGVRDEVIFLTAKCGKTEIGFTKETGWLDDKSFQFPAATSTRDLNDILRIGLDNKSSRKIAENSSRTKSPKFKLNLQSLRNEKAKDVTIVVVDTGRKSVRTDKTGNSTHGKSNGGSHRSFQSFEDEKSTRRSAKSQEERDGGTSRSEKSSSHLEGRKSKMEKMAESSSFRSCSEESENKYKETRDGSSSSGSDSSGGGSRRPGRREEARSDRGNGIRRKAQRSQTGPDGGTESRKTCPDEARRRKEVKSAEVAREHSEKSSKSEGRPKSKKTKSTTPRASSSSGSSDNSSSNVDLTESFRHLKEEIIKTLQAPYNRSSRRSGRTSIFEGSKEESFENSKVQERDESSDGKNCCGAEESASGERENSKKTGDSVRDDSDRSMQKSERGSPEKEGPKDGCGWKKAESERAAVTSESSFEKMDSEGTDESSSTKCRQGRNSKKEARAGRKFSNESIDRTSDARKAGGGMWKDLIESFHGNQESPLGPQGSFPGFPSQKENFPCRKEEDADDGSFPTSKRAAEAEKESSVEKRDGDFSSEERSGEKADEKYEGQYGRLGAPVPLTEKFLQSSQTPVHQNPQRLFYFDVGMPGILGIGEFGDVAPWDGGDVKTVQPEAPKAHGDGNSADCSREGLSVRRDRPKKGKEFRVLRQLWTESRDDLNAGDGAGSDTRSLSTSLKLSKSSTCVSAKEDAVPEAVGLAKTNSDRSKKRNGEKESQVRPVSKTAEEESLGSSEESGSEEAEGFLSDAPSKMWQSKQSFVNSKAFFEKTTKAGEKESNVFLAQRAKEKAEAKGNNWLVVRGSRRRRGKRKCKVPSRECSRGSDREFLFGRGLRSSVTPLKFRNSSCLRNFYKRLIGVFCLTSDSSVGSSK